MALFQYLEKYIERVAQLRRRRNNRKPCSGGSYRGPVYSWLTFGMAFLPEFDRVFKFATLFYNSKIIHRRSAC